ncbi:MAG TPA: hypothetical protein VMT29_17905 [Steroidobacteraceae bacterium]|nr:hypothetical protein [Steroidobacteraceae bacterium]
MKVIATANAPPATVPHKARKHVRPVLLAVAESEPPEFAALASRNSRPETLMAARAIANASSVMMAVAGRVHAQASAGAGRRCSPGKHGQVLSENPPHSWMNQAAGPPNSPNVSCHTGVISLRGV